MGFQLVVIASLRFANEVEKDKQGQPNGSTFFPQGWSEARLKYELSEAFKISQLVYVHKKVLLLLHLLG